MSLVSLEELLSAGAHFGHLTRRWNPKMREFIFMQKNGIHILDLKKTQSSLDVAVKALSRLVSDGYDVLFVGTKPQAREIIAAEAQRANQYYVTNRWLGGMLTNFTTIKKSIKHLKDLEKMGTDGTYTKISKKEVLMIEREKEKLLAVLGGIQDMKRLPGAIFIVDTKKEHIAVHEARKMNIPVFAMVDTNSDPTLIDFPVPANDDAAKSISLIAAKIADAIIAARQKAVEEKAIDEAVHAEKADVRDDNMRKAAPRRTRKPGKPGAGKTDSDEMVNEE